MDIFSDEIMLETIHPIVNENKNLIVGIDGLDDSGKTTLAEFLGEKLKMRIFSLDNYLKQNKDKSNYTDDFDYIKLKQNVDSVRGKEPFIIEGNRLLQILNKIGLDINLLIYVKRVQRIKDNCYSYIWRDEDDCNFNESLEEKINKKTDECRKSSNDGKYNLGDFRIQQFEYCQKFKPYDRANHTYCRFT